MQAVTEAQLIEVLKQIAEQLQKISSSISHLHSDLTRIATNQ